MEWISVKTGNVLVRKPEMFYFRGVSFHGLVDEKANALYDDPDDSFAAAGGIQSSLELGLISQTEPKVNAAEIK
jgi:hypothetical protein